MSISRRYFLKTAGAFALGFTGLHTFVDRSARGAVSQIGFGPLESDPRGILDLPEAFSYEVISRAGDKMVDGFYVPGAPDGMATFPGPDGLTILIRNHEVSSGASNGQGAFGENGEELSRISADRFYDAGRNPGRPCLGGTTTLVYNTKRRSVVREYLSLAGTIRNCAGGPTPWNSWITCEETVTRAGRFSARDHGFNFEVPASVTPRLADPVPLKDMGRFNHEAVAVDPDTSIVYQTEDRHDGLIYRFLPDEAENLAAGGRLQALSIVGSPSFDTRNWDSENISPGEAVPVEWIDMEDVKSPDDDLRFRGFEKGAARFARGEGMWYADGAVYFACTNGGRNKKGQIWRYVPESVSTPSPGHGAPGTLELFVEPNDGEVIENADNLTVAPWGDVVVCEDGSGDQFLVGVTPDGEFYELGHNAISNSEFAGATFSPDGSTLFVNIQGDGLTLAITGPWNQG